MSLGDDLRHAVKGQVLVSGDDGFEEATRPWNVAVQQPVRAVVSAEDADDVAALVRYARRGGLTVTAQASGHGASGNAEGLILLRTRRLGGVEVRAHERIARVGAGIQWGEVLAAAGPHGLTGLAGSSPVVSVTGYTLGGGLSWFGRKYGWASESVRAFDIVDAEGAQATVTADSDPELFWALRGGGGDLAIVAAVEFDLHPAPSLYGGRIIWHAERAPEALAAFREVTADAADELTVWLQRADFPDVPALPESLRGLSMVSADVAFLGQEREGQELLRRFSDIEGALADTRAVLPVAELGAITAEPTDPSPGRARAELLTELSDEVCEKLLTERIAPLIFWQLRHLGGALSRSVKGGGATEPRSEPYAFYMHGVPATPEIAAAVRARQSEIAGVLAPHISGGKPFNFLAAEESSALAFSAESHARLRRVKQTRDPQGVIRGNYPLLS